MSLRGCQYLVFDEADRLFEMGFAEQLKQVGVGGRWGCVGAWWWGWVGGGGACVPGGGAWVPGGGGVCGGVWVWGLWGLGGRIVDPPLLGSAGWADRRQSEREHQQLLDEALLPGQSKAAPSRGAQRPYP
jgi:hypothetical protein